MRIEWTLRKWSVVHSVYDAESGAWGIADRPQEAKDNIQGNIWLLSRESNQNNQSLYKSIKCSLRRFFKWDYVFIIILSLKFDDVTMETLGWM